MHKTFTTDNKVLSIRLKPPLALPERFAFSSTSSALPLTLETPSINFKSTFSTQRTSGSLTFYMNGGESQQAEWKCRNFGIWIFQLYFNNWLNFCLMKKIFKKFLTHFFTLEIKKKIMLVRNVVITMKFPLGVISNIKWEFHCYYYISY